MSTGRLRRPEGEASCVEPWLNAPSPMESDHFPFFEATLAIATPQASETGSDDRIFADEAPVGIMYAEPHGAVTPMLRWQSPEDFGYENPRPTPIVSSIGAII